MLNSYKIGFIGCGNLAKSIIEGILNSKQLSNNQIAVFSRSPKKVKNFIAKFKPRLINSLAELIQNSEIIILAVKPKDSLCVLREINETCRILHFRTTAKNSKLKNKIKLVSFVAGLSVKEISKNLTFQNLCCNFEIARAMTSLAIMDRQGTTAIFSEQRSFSKELNNILKDTGHVSIVKRERDIDAFTALVSAPAFISLAYQGVTEGALKTGLNKTTVKKVVDTLFKALPNVIDRNSYDLADYPKIKSPSKLLRKKIATPNGTTEAGLKLLNEEKVVNDFSSSVIAAFERARVLMKK